VNAIASQVKNVIAALQQLRDTPTELCDTHESPAVIVTGTEKFEFVALLSFWSEVLFPVEWIPGCLHGKEVASQQTLNQFGTLILSKTIKMSSVPEQFLMLLCNEWECDSEYANEKKTLLSW
jgi:hypothetical protein